MLEPNGNIGVSWLHSQTLLYKREHRRFTTFESALFRFYTTKTIQNVLLQPPKARFEWFLAANKQKNKDLEIVVWLLQESQNPKIASAGFAGTHACKTCCWRLQNFGSGSRSKRDLGLLVPCVVV